MNNNKCCVDVFYYLKKKTNKINIEKIKNKINY